MLWICSPQNFVISAKWFLFVSRRRWKGYSFQENQMSEVVGDLSRLSVLPRLILRGGNPKSSQESGLNALAEGEKRKSHAPAKGRVIGHAAQKIIQRFKVCPNFPRTDWLDGFQSYTVILQSHLTLDHNYNFNDSYANYIFSSFIRFIVFSTSDHIANKTYLNRTSLSVHCY